MLVDPDMAGFPFLKGKKGGGGLFWPVTLLNDCSRWEWGRGRGGGGHAAGRGGREAVGGGTDIDSKEKKMGKKGKESQHLFPGQQGAAEHKSDLSPPHTHAHPPTPPAFAALASHSDAGTSSD